MDTITSRISNLNEELRTDESFDLIYRTIRIGERTACLYFIDGFVKDDILQKLMDFFTGIQPEDIKDSHSFLKENLPYVEADITSDVEDFKTAVLSGSTGLIVDGLEDFFIIDCRTYPSRSVEEPDKDKVLRGSRDGFVETIVMNAALIRRRIRDTSLTISMMNAGKKSKTDIAVCYLDGKVNQKLLKEITDRIAAIDAEALTMNQESLAECLYKGKWLNPFPKFKYTERPDTAASAILEGHIVILVDNSPAAMILPTNFFDLIEEADDYYFPPVTATYLRLSRIIISLFTLFLTPVFLLFVKNPGWLPDAFQFVAISDEVNIPVFWQFLILEIAIDGMKLAAVNTPNMLNTPLSIIAGIILSDSAVKSGWFNDECLLYMAFAAFGTYTMESFEFGFAMKFFRIFLLIAVQIANLWGLCIGILLLFVFLFTNKTISKESYMYPLFPFDAKALFHKLVRVQKTGR
jgi:stage V sporulation protein AF